MTNSTKAIPDATLADLRAEVDRLTEIISGLEAALRVVVVEYERDAGCAISLKAEVAVRVAFDTTREQEPRCQLCDSIQRTGEGVPSGCPDCGGD